MGRGSRAAVLLSVSLLAACSSASRDKEPARHGISPAARSYLVAALDIMQQHALDRMRIDWPSLRQRALHQAARAGARTPADVYGVIRLTLASLDDNFHSRFYPPGALTQGGGIKELPAGHLLTRSPIGYLALPGAAAFRDVNGHYIAAADTVLENAKQRRICGWILDLRDDTGGDVWPMLVATQPLLGSGIVGYFVPTGRPRISVRVTRSAAYQGSTVMAHAATPNRPTLAGAPVAVITGPHTASSGEFLTVAFRGRPRSLFLGLPTSGVPTANDTFRLSDGAVLALTTAHDADRTGHVYPDAHIQPDQTIPNASPTATASYTDPAIHAAQRWLTTQQSCGGS